MVGQEETKMQSIGEGVTEWEYLTRHEMTYLLSLSESPSSRLSRQHLALEALTEGDQTGVSTLIVRGLGSIEDGVVVPDGHAALASWVLSTASEWVEVGVVDDTTADALLLATNDQAGLMFAAGPLGIFRLASIPAGTDMRRFAASFVAGTLELDGKGPTTLSVRRFTLVADVSVAVRVVDGQWSAAGPIPYLDALQKPTGPVPTPRTVTRSEAMAEFEAVLGLIAVEPKLS